MGHKETKGVKRAIKTCSGHYWQPFKHNSLGLPHLHVPVYLYVRLIL